MEEDLAMADPAPGAAAPPAMTEAEAVAWKTNVLDQYTKVFDDYVKVTQAKPDMKAASDLKHLRPVPRFGHIPGIKPGECFDGKGQLDVLGLHVGIMRGIYPSKSGGGAYSIVMSGAYADDDDQGSTFWYTGEGGQNGKTGKSAKQIYDQKEVNGNKALMENYKSGNPVRVFRGKQGPDGKRLYVYEGLYDVKEVKYEPGKDGPKVYTFKMVGREEESVATVKVEHHVFLGHTRKPQIMRRIKLAAAAPVAGPSNGRPAKRVCTSASAASKATSKTKSAAEAAADLQARRKKVEKAAQKRPFLIALDIANGKEPLPIPAFNEVDAQPFPTELDYISEYVWAPGTQPGTTIQDEVRGILDEADRQMESFMGMPKDRVCGINFNRRMRQLDIELKNTRGLPQVYHPETNTFDTYEVTNEIFYSDDGLLLGTEPLGVHECSAECKNKLCKNNRQATHGIRVPLEVFKTKHRGWGVRCSEPIHSGQFVVAYIGELQTDAMADNSTDTYHFNLDHFVEIYEEIAKIGIGSVDLDLPAHKVPPHLSTKQMADAAVAHLQKKKAAARAAAATAQAADAATAAAVTSITAAIVMCSDAAASQSAQHAGCVMCHDVEMSAPAVEDSSSPIADVEMDSSRPCTWPASPSPAPRDGENMPAAAQPGPVGGLIAGPVLGAGDQVLSQLQLPAVASAAVAAAASTAGAAAVAGSIPTAHAVAAAAGAQAAVEDAAAAHAKAEAEAEVAELLRLPACPLSGGWCMHSDPEKEEYVELLVVNALHHGNVARFINHRCNKEGNLLQQPIFKGEARNTLYHYIGFFAQRDIPAFEELTYSYNYKANSPFAEQCMCETCMPGQA